MSTRAFLRRFVAITGLAALPTLLVAQVAPEKEEEQVREAVSTVMRQYMATSQVPGAVVGVSVHGRRYFFHYGKADSDGAPFTPDTLVEIGSNTKTFTTTLFVLALERQQMEADESIQKHMPDRMKLELLAQKATPLELASFQTGMPDDPTNLPPKLEMRSIQHYTPKDFLNWVAHWKPEVPPPAPYKYSNAGIGLLGYLVMDATGKNWEEADRRRNPDAAWDERYGSAAQPRTEATTGTRASEKWQERTGVADLRVVCSRRLAIYRTRHAAVW